ncbi:hypothetical protein ABB37_09746 [Leptomonas pyrrhocoris]|uniref:Uncharacterized protein n=1 Tax=Leptomonas pyrrhocoris TaxID=157538 RepID=A0A0N0DQW7_LEPPY|nr:hypothetical protein ABB37_09746 [Leptomonas pyrrhocoris]KPA73614.1 hypothetical protein ABB37_09746 [Leptomonas pyrrhocoris]|eukprot:XP_015652053.1 hypothetical protein ABB37_09746 [Leptomonas pyrrhocoris]
MSKSTLDTANTTIAKAPPPAAAAAEPHGSGFPAKGTFNRMLQSHESIAHDMSGNLKARRSTASYDYLAGQDDDQRPPGISEKFSYHMPKKPSSKRSYDYLDEDQNRAPPIPQASAESLTKHANGGYFESDSDDEDATLDHQIRMLEAKKAMHGKCCIGNPGPIGMFAFGMTIIQFSLYNTRVFDRFSVIPAISICFGGGTGMIMGVLEWVKGSTFAYVTFVAYGAFWFSIVCVWMLPNNSNGGPPEISPPSDYFVGVFYLLWAFFSIIVTLCTLRMNVVIFLVFLTTLLMFFSLAGGYMANNRTAIKAAGYEGALSGGFAMYLGVAEVVNEVWDRTLLPVIPMTQVLGWFGAKTGTEDEEDDASEEETDEGERVPAHKVTPES